MNRREVLAGATSLAALAGAGWYALGRPAREDRRGTRIDPVTVETLAAPHSSAGTVAVPVPGEVTVIDVFATWCKACDDQLRSLAAAYERVGDRARFVSVTNQAIGGGLTRDDIRTFWREHAGRWPVALDDEGRLTTRLGVPGLPYTAVIDPDRRVVHAEQGVTSADAVVSAVGRAAGAV